MNHLHQFKTIDSMWQHALSDLNKHGQSAISRLGDTREILDYHFAIEDLDYTFLVNPRRHLSPTYACAEFLWYMSGDRTIDGIVPYASQYRKFSEDGIAHGAYGYRIENNCPGHCQLELVIETLRKSSESRQAIITLWDAAHDSVPARDGTKSDMPCTLSFQFLQRKGLLHMITTMRSEDIWLGLPYDVFCNTMLQRIVANELNLALGTYYHSVGSLHLYSKNFEAASDAQTIDVETIGHEWRYGTNLADVRKAVALERVMRVAPYTGPGFFVSSFLGEDWLSLGESLRDIVGCCALRWGANYQPKSWSLYQGVCDVDSRRS